MTAAATKFHRPAGASFPVRHPDLQLEELPRYWAGGDPFVTHFMNVMSGLFPDGEQFFVDSLRPFRDRIKNPQLQKDIGAFIGQESVHSREHSRYNRQADAEGMDIAFVERMTAALMKLWRMSSPEQQLALTAGTEHFTAVLTQALMEDAQLLARLHDKRMQRMWLWHSIEENEHKSVAFDALKEINDSYPLRISTYVFMLSCGIPLVLGCVARQMIKDGHTFNGKSWKNGFSMLFGRRGLLLAHGWRLLDYFHPGFHPNDHDASALMEKWREELQLNETTAARARG